MVIGGKKIHKTGILFHVQAYTYIERVICNNKWIRKEKNENEKKDRKKSVSKANSGGSVNLYTGRYDDGINDSPGRYNYTT